MVKIDELNEFLNDRCPETDLASRDGIFYLPIENCEAKLDKLRIDFGVTWHTENYSSRIYKLQDDLIVSASIEVILTGEGYRRRLVGATTFYASHYLPNTFFDAIAKSLAVVNACADLGNQFGRFLSSQERKGGFPTGKPAGGTKKAAVKRMPDGSIRTKYARAVANDDKKMVEQLEAMYDFSNKQ